jgi:hypothetical protein
MLARVGDRIFVRGRRTGQPDRQCTVLETRHELGQPPYVVRWDDSDLQDLFFPRLDAFIINRNSK